MPKFCAREQRHSGRGGNVVFCRRYCMIHGGDIERLLNHLVGASDQCVWNIEFERLGGLQIYVQRDFGGPLDRQVAGLVALENAPSIISSQAVRVADVGSVTQQTAGRGEFASLVYRRYAVAGSQHSELFAVAGKKWGAANHQRVRLQLDTLCENSIKVLFACGVQHMKLQSEGTAWWKHRSDRGLSKSGIIPVHEQSHGTRIGKQCVQQFRQFWRYLLRQLCHACNVAPWPIEVSDQAQLDRVGARFKDNRNTRGRRLCGKRRRSAARGNYSHLTTNQISGHRR